MTRQPLPPASDRAVAVVPQLLAILSDTAILLRGSHGDCYPDSCQHAELLRAITHLARYIGQDMSGELHLANGCLSRLGWEAVAQGFTEGYRYADR